jgi:cell division septal protein FtsQ
MPILLPLLIIIYFLGRISKYESRISHLNFEIENQVSNIIDILNMLELEKKESTYTKDLENLRKKRNELKEEDYFNQLNELKKSLESKLNTNP